MVSSRADGAGKSALRRPADTPNSRPLVAPVHHTVMLAIKVALIFEDENRWRTSGNQLRMSRNYVWSSEITRAAIRKFRRDLLSSGRRANKSRSPHVSSRRRTGRLAAAQVCWNAILVFGNSVNRRHGLRYEISHRRKKYVRRKDLHIESNDLQTFPPEKPPTTEQRSLSLAHSFIPRSYSKLLLASFFTDI